MRRLAYLLLFFTLLGALVAGLGYWLLDRPHGLVGGGRRLTLRLDSPLAEHDLAGGLPLPGSEPPLTLSVAYRGLRAARTDPRIRGLELYIQDAAFGLAKAQELRRQLTLLREAGKSVDCYLETAGEGSNGTLEYYLASACGDIALAPAGEINLLGLLAQGPFLRGGLDKLKIEPSFLTAGAFKSAAEMFTETGHSPAARLALDELLDGFFSQIVRGIAGERHKEEDEVRAWVDRAPLSASEALADGLVDRLEYPDEFRDRVEEEMGDDAESLADYAARVDRRSASGRKVAILYALGAIYRGGSGTDPFSGELALGATEFSRHLVRLAEDDSVAAVVLRIDSPGGSALASDLILREVERLVEKKPVIVSMSDVAASGGYYIASRATRIVAEEATITGSIGVVSGKLASGRFQKELLGVTYDPLTRGANAELYSTLKPFDERELAVMRRRIDEVYGRFLDHVAAGRGLPREEVEAVAGGRVWTGADALPRHLVDEIGGLDRAIALAREEAGIAPDATVALTFLPRPGTLWDWLREQRRGGLAALLQARNPLLGISRRLLAPLPGDLSLDPEFLSLVRPE